MKFYDVQLDPLTVSTYKENPSFKPHFDTGHRWVGKLCEDTFVDLCEKENIKVKNHTRSGPSWTDFTVAGMKIDLKAVVTKYYPKEDYACNILKKQFDQNKEVTHYIFCRFIETKNTVVFLGIISKRRFEKDKVERMAGDSVTKHYKSHEPHYEVLINQLNSMDEFFDYAYFKKSSK